MTEAKEEQSLEKKIRLDNEKDLTSIDNLYKHALQVFPSVDKFHAWLNTENFMGSPVRGIDFLIGVNKNIQAIDNLITGIQYGYV